LDVKQTALVLIIALIPFVFYQNCGKPTGLVYSSSVDLNSQAGIQDAAIQVVSKHCSECHSATTMNGNVGDLTDINYAVYSRLIIPGEPELSPIISEITQGLMPAGRPSLSGDEVEILKSWIKGMSPNDLGPGTTPVITTIDPKYSVLAAKIFTAQCTTCHAGKNYKLNSYSELLRVVTPGDAANSLLYKAITVGSTGGKMPQGGALSSAQIKAIQDWINAGALNN
jgi:mono/diheme cytochrome c family protein